MRGPSFGIFLLAQAICGAPALLAQQADRARVIATIDSLANEPIAAGRVAGMSIAVVRGSDTIVLKGYGYADLELDVPTPDRAVYEIGSVTKQFTAAAVLQLAHAGKLSLDDDITTYLPDYPTQGHGIPVRRLLDHTSGIKGYTEMPVFWTQIAALRLPRDTLVTLFAAQPFDFAPGEAMIYNNSAYFLLGLIIERASGLPYEGYVERHLFAPAGMTDSRYCSERDITRRRAKGYQMGEDGLRRAEYLVHTWPYAAGSLCSTVGDLVAWQRALHGHGGGGSLLPPEVYRAMTTPGTLNDGTRLRYGNGLGFTERRGRRRIAHGGGIFGFLSELRFYPDDDLVIAVLINTAGPVSPSSIADRIEELVLAPLPEPDVAYFAGSVEPFVGTYQGPGRGQPFRAVIARDSVGLTVRISNGEPRPLRQVGKRTFAAGSTLYHFGSGTETSELRVDQVAGHYILRKTKE